MRRFRRIMLIALASGVLALLIVPFLVPVESTGTLTAAQGAGEGAQFVELAGLQVHVETAAYTGGRTGGEGDGAAAAPPVIVLLHGFGASTFSWREVIEPLTAVGDVVAYDRPGFGFTERPTAWPGENPYGTPGNLLLLDAVINQFAEGRETIVVGHSAGGQIAAEYARVNPEKVDRLVLVAPAISANGGLPGWLVPVLRIPQIDQLGPLAVAGIASSGDDILRQSFVDQRKLTDAVFDGYRRPLTVDGWEAGLWRVTTAPRDNGLLANLGSIAQPVLVITGDADTVVPTADSEALAPKFANAELVVIPRSGHLPHEEAADLFLPAMLDWVARTGR